MGTRKKTRQDTRKKRSSPDAVEQVTVIKEDDELAQEENCVMEGGKKKMVTIEELQLQLQREMEEEERVLGQADVIRQNLSEMKMNAAPEPKRQKTHWDHVLQEMLWLAKEFQKERRWKIQNAKRFASTVQRSNLDLESRVFIREREEEKAAKKRAAWIAKEVMGLWNKAHKVVAFKVKTEVDARKKQVLDKQMDVLLKQTQKYSSLLADRLRTGGESMPVSVSKSLDVKQEEGDVEELHVETKRTGTPARSGTGEYQEDDDEMDYRSGEDDDADDEATLEEEEQLARQELGDKLIKEQMDETKGLEDDAELPLDKLLARYGYVVPDHDRQEDDPGVHPGSLRKSDLQALLMEPSYEKPESDLKLLSHDQVVEDEDEYRSGEDDDADDEATLEEEERAALAESGANLAKVQAEERAGLEEDAELSLEELLATYKGYKPFAEQGMPETFRPKEDLGILTKDAIIDDTEDMDEYRSGEDDDADDEATLEEEERAALAESGANLVKVQAEERAGLEEDAEIPLEDLLAKYKGYKPMEDVSPSDVKQENDSSHDNDKENTGMSGALEAMAAAQPTGYTLATTQVKTPIPFLLKGQLREYQHIGLDWLVTLYHKHLNGILADEMGLGKTIQTIALLSWLACERGDWGPHLIVVPTSVMLNWEMEFKRWCPAFKLLTYYGTPKERAAKRQGWSKPNAFHVCITSYTLILQDARMFRRKKWKYLILDEAHMIKNWKSQRWQTLLNFNSKRRLLITGTPLQNDLMELWSLMHFLMPQVFASHAQFKDWFSNPLTGMVEGSAEYNKAIISRLHSVLRPFLLRRLKKDVEKQLPEKHEHIIKCRLSKRQRQLYEEYVSQTETKNVLASGNFMGIMNCLMQLRKVCNHPDLFEGRPIISAFDMDPLSIYSPSLVAKQMIDNSRPDLQILNLGNARDMSSWERDALNLVESKSTFLEPQTTPEEDLSIFLGSSNMTILRSLGRTPSPRSLSVVSKFLKDLALKRKEWRMQRMQSLGDLSWARIKYMPPVFGDSLCSVVKINQLPRDIHLQASEARTVTTSATLLDMIKLPDTRSEGMVEFLKNFVFVIPKARTKFAELISGIPQAKSFSDTIIQEKPLWDQYRESTALLHAQKVRKQLFFPDRRLLQYDCGKLQELASLLSRLNSGGHRALIFTQMSKMLDILEAFLNIHGYTYVRLDGATKPEMRQTLMQRFNTNPKIFCFILSTRSGGVGMNLTGADTVIFYDSDWNPAMDAQAQDRCHRIGQTREVHIYRLISEHTIEENILRKSDQKRHLDFLAIQSGGFNTDILYGASSGQMAESIEVSGDDKNAWKEAMRAVEDEGDAAAAAAVEKETAAEMEEFTREAPAPSAISEDDKSKDEESEADGDKREQSEKLEEDDEVMKEVVRMAHTDNGPYDPMQALNDALRPIERYAVRFIENYSDKIDKEALTAQMEATYKVQNFDINAMEEAEGEREADIDADEEANVVAEWDQEVATKTYEEQVKAAEEEERKRAEAEEAWLAQQILLGIPEAPAPKRGRVGRPKKIPGSDDTLQHEIQATDEIKIGPKLKKTLMYPWDIQEDLVLTAVVYILTISGEKKEDFIWNTASGALAAGCAASDSADMQPLSRKGKLRTNQACRDRYRQLQNAYMAAKAMSENDMMTSEGYLQKLLAPAIKGLDLNLKEAETARGNARTAVSTILKALDSRQDNKISNTLAIELHAVRTGTSRWSALLDKPEDTSVSLSIPVAAGILKVVKDRCGEQQYLKIEPRLSAVIQAAKIESAYFN